MATDAVIAKLGTSVGRANELDSDSGLRDRGARHSQLAGMHAVSVARRLGSEGPLLTYCGAPL